MPHTSSDAREHGAASGVLLSIVFLAALLAAGLYYLNAGSAPGTANATSGFVPSQVAAQRAAPPAPEKVAVADAEELAAQHHVRFERDGTTVFRSPKQFVATVAGGNQIGVKAELRVSGHVVQESKDPAAAGYLRRGVALQPKLVKKDGKFKLEKTFDGAGEAPVQVGAGEKKN